MSPRFSDFKVLQPKEQGRAAMGRKRRNLMVVQPKLL